MGQIHTAHARITEEELIALLGPVAGQLPVAIPDRLAQREAVGVDTWFKYRMVFLLAVAMTYAAKLLFFPALVTANFDLGTSALSLNQYLQYRAGFVILISAVYVYSYLKDWHFEQVSLVVLTVSVTALMLDYFNAYVHLSQTPAQWIAGLITLRFLAIFCLLMNAMSARHAPPMPRRLWS
jgi:hypothetical protein